VWKPTGQTCRSSVQKMAQQAEWQEIESIFLLVSSCVKILARKDRQYFHFANVTSFQ
jgi:hypothetical protein